LSNVYLSKSVGGCTTNKDYAVAIDRIVYDFDLNDPTDIYFLEDDEKFGTGGENSKVVATVKTNKK
jgi:hypothetical protein